MSDLGNKKIMAKNIQHYMDKYGKSRKDMCDALGVKYTTFTDWVKGKAYPRIDKIELMANYFGIEKSDLVESRDVSIETISKGVKIPVLGYVAAGIPIDTIENIIDWEEIPRSMANTGEYFGLIINGDSMEPRICKGDTVIVRKQSDVDSGDIAIVIVNGDHGTCKKVVKHDNGLSLVSFNPVYEPMFYTWQEVENLPITINGKVVELRGKF